MGGGYVLDFSNRSFEEFFREVVGIQIYSPQFEQLSGSKANRIQAFWQTASKEQLLRFLLGLADGWEIYANADLPDSAQKLLSKIINRLGGSSGTSEVEEDTNTPVALSKYPPA